MIYIFLGRTLQRKQKKEGKNKGIKKKKIHTLETQQDKKEMTKVVEEEKHTEMKSELHDERYFQSDV